MCCRRMDSARILATGTARPITSTSAAGRVRHAGRYRGAGIGAAGPRRLQGSAVVASLARHGEGGRPAQHRRGALARLLGAMGQADARMSRAEVEDFLYHEAALLDAW